jgi:hypothetical protein
MHRYSPFRTRVTSDPVIDLLREDHARTRHLLRRALRLTLVHGPDRGAGDIARSMIGFFRYWSPLHELDEEQTLVPTLNAHAPGEDSSFAVERSMREHVALDDLRDRAGQLWGELANEPALLPEIHDRLSAATRLLVRVMSVHMAWEERDVFPRFERLVPLRERIKVLDVILARRARPSTTPSDLIVLARAG